jgi:hypothetical protein
MAISKKLSFGPSDKTTTERVEYVDPKTDIEAVEKLDNGSSSSSHDEDKNYRKPPSSARDLVSEVLILEDDPTLNPWTFRMWFLGICLSLFAAYVSSSS